MCFSILLLICGAHARLRYNTIRESFGWKSSSGDSINHRGPLNPFLGFFLEHNGVVHNKRFFSPDNCASYSFSKSDGKRTYNRHYEKDHPVGSGDTFHRILLSFFPSSKGSVSIYSRCSRTFIDVLTERRDRAMAIRLLAVLAAMSQGADIGYETSTAGCKKSHVVIHASPSIEVEENDACPVIDIIRFFSDSRDNEKFLESRTFLLQSFLFHFLNEREEVEMFFTSVYGFMRNTENTCFLSSENPSDCIDYSFLDSIVRMVQMPLRVIQFPEKATLPFYVRAKDEFVEKVRFSCRTEIVLLSLMCYLLRDAGTMMYSTEHLGDGAENMRTFFTKHPNATKITEEIAKDWLRVVEDLPDPSVEYSKAIGGHSCSRNMMNPGLINLLVALKNICGVVCDADTEWTKSAEMPSRYEDIKGEFEKAFDCVLSQACPKKPFCEFRNMGVQPFKKEWEVFGTVTVSIPAGNGVYIVVEVTHTARGADARFSQSPFVCSERSKSEVLGRAEKYIESGDTLTSLIGRWMRLCMFYGMGRSIFYDSLVHSLEKGKIEEILLQGRICTDGIKMRLLDVIFSQKHKKNRALKHIEHNIIASVDLNGAPMRDVFFMFISFRKTLKKKFSKILPYEWRQKNKSAKLHAIVQSGCVNLVCYCIRKKFGVEANTSYTFSDLLAVLIEYDRKDVVEQLLKIHKHNPQVVLGSGFNAATKTFKTEYANYFFGKISKSDLEKMDYSVSHQRSTDYLSRLALERGTENETLERIYFWFFCDRNGLFCMKDLYDVVKRTYMRLSMDFVYDCMVRRCPRYHNFVKFHKLFLDLAVKNKIRVRNDALVLIKHLARRLDESSCYVFLGRNPVKLSRQNTSRELKRELLDAIGDVERLGIADSKVSFDENVYTTFLDKYASEKHGCPRKSGKKYASEIKSIFGEK